MLVPLSLSIFIGMGRSYKRPKDTLLSEQEISELEDAEYQLTYFRSLGLEVDEEELDLDNLTVRSIENPILIMSRQVRGFK